MIVFPREDNLLVEFGMSKAFTANGILARILDDCRGTTIDRFYFDNTGREAFGKLFGILVDDRFSDGNLGKKSVISDG